MTLEQFRHPLQFPDGTQDNLNPVRLLIGYGPESMYVAYNRFYPPDLAQQYYDSERPILVEGQSLVPFIEDDPDDRHTDDLRG